MYIVSIFGGLASQMNQFAFIEALKKRYPNVDIKMAIASDWEATPEHNGYELDRVFGIQKDTANISQIAKLADFSLFGGIRGKIDNFIIKAKKSLKIYKSNQITVMDPTISMPSLLEYDPNKDWFFWSNFPIEQSYSLVLDEIDTLFCFKPTLSNDNAEILNKIIESNSVSLHVRHGDYKKLGYPILNIQYYIDAVKFMNEKVDNPHYFIFSDDTEYLQKNFDFIKNKTIINNNIGLNSYVDMQLMSNCKHNIIANSGFSFCGALLNNNKNKIVIAPGTHLPWCKRPVAMPDWKTIDNSFSK
jgi:hypothetical protein